MINRDGKEIIVSSIGDDSGRIDELIKLLQKGKNDGATHYEMVWDKSGIRDFKWFRLFAFKSYDEIKRDEIRKLETKLAELKGL